MSKYKITFEEKDSGNRYQSMYELTVKIPQEEIEFIKGENRFAVLAMPLYNVAVAEPEAMNGFVKFNFTWLSNKKMGHKYMNSAWFYYKKLAIRIEYSDYSFN